MGPQDGEDIILRRLGTRSGEKLVFCLKAVGEGLVKVIKNGVTGPLTVLRAFLAIEAISYPKWIIKLL